MPDNKESQNKARVLKAFDALFNKRDYAEAERYWSPRYIQHSAHIQPMLQIPNTPAETALELNPLVEKKTSSECTPKRNLPPIPVGLKSTPTMSLPLN